tara:strand:+ start:240 stop:551 length:312 start_codon:yes stop_codon:yes gene_type:complete
MENENEKSKGRGFLSGITKSQRLSLCTPALIYLVFSVISFLLLAGQGNASIWGILVMIIFTLFLNVLCKTGHKNLSWGILFLPFIVMIAFIVIFIVLVFSATA